MKTLEEIEACGKPFLTAEDISDYLGIGPQNIRSQAQDDSRKLGFPVIVCGTRVKIPTMAFARFIRGE